MNNPKPKNMHEYIIYSKYNGYPEPNTAKLIRDVHNGNSLVYF